MIRPDLQAHAWAGAAIAAALLPTGPAHAALAVGLAAVVREVYNWRAGGEFDLLDLLATCLGGVAMTVWLTGFPL